jgi:fido (protein-threonine AMPylation protein)
MREQLGIVKNAGSDFDLWSSSYVRPVNYFDQASGPSLYLVKMPRPSRETVYERFEQAVGDLEEIGGLPSLAEAKGIWEDIWYEEAHHSTAMEGNTLIQHEVQLLLFEGRAVGSKEFAAYLEVQGYADASMWVYGQAVRTRDFGQRDRGITIAELREIHRRVVEPAWRFFPPAHLDRRDGPGEFRHTDIEPLRPGLKPPQVSDVRPMIDAWIEKAAVAGSVLYLKGPHTIEEFADLHAEFERIHPFNDGNGRTGRLVLNLLLVRHGYPPAVIHKKDRNRYLDGLRRADEGDAGLLGEVLARSVKHGIDRFLLPGLAGPHRFVPLAALTDMGFSQNALALAAKRGRLEATQRFGQWYSSRKCVEDYKATRYRRAS